MVAVGPWTCSVYLGRVRVQAGWATSRGGAWPSRGRDAWADRAAGRDAALVGGSAAARAPRLGGGVAGRGGGRASRSRPAGVAARRGAPGDLHAWGVPPRRVQPRRGGRRA